MIVEGVPYCDVCGTDGSDREGGLRIDFNHEEALEIICPFCRGLIDSGMVRFDGAQDGVRRYRQWQFEWRPGPLLPAPLRPAPDDA